MHENLLSTKILFSSSIARRRPSFFSRAAAIPEKGKGVKGKTYKNKLTLSNSFWFHRQRHDVSAK